MSLAILTVHGVEAPRVMCELTPAVEEHDPPELYTPVYGYKRHDFGGQLILSEFEKKKSNPELTTSKLERDESN